MTAPAHVAAAAPGREGSDAARRQPCGRGCCARLRFALRRFASAAPGHVLRLRTARLSRVCHAPCSAPLRAVRASISPCSHRAPGARGAPAADLLAAGRLRCARAQPALQQSRLRTALRRARYRRLRAASSRRAAFPRPTCAGHDSGDQPPGAFEAAPFVPDKRRPRSLPARGGRDRGFDGAGCATGGIAPGTARASAAANRAAALAARHTGARRASTGVASRSSPARRSAAVAAAKRWAGSSRLASMPESGRPLPLIRRPTSPLSPKFSGQLAASRGPPSA